MPLIIDTYEVPACEISKAILNNANIEPVDLDLIFGGSFVDKDKIYYVHKEVEFDLRRVKYYFNEIIEVDTFIMYINKRRRSLKYFRMINVDGKFKVEEIKESRKSTSFDKTNFLPYLKAQENEIVIFPEEDEE